MIGTRFSDILFGTPTVRETEANLGVLEENKVNIILHGHEPSLSEMIVLDSLKILLLRKVYQIPLMQHLQPRELYHIYLYLLFLHPTLLLMLLILLHLLLYNYHLYLLMPLYELYLFGMGPCRITPKTPRGLCGADEHVIVGRNYARMVAGGTAAHSDHARDIAHTMAIPL